MEPSKRWRWLGIEFLVIALGVFAALAVDTWVQNRENGERAAEYRGRLIADLQQDVANLHGVTAYYHRIREYGLMTLADLEGKQRLEDFMLMFAAFNAAEEWGFQLQSATYNDLQNTGALTLIKDVQLRLDLADYHRQAVTRERVWQLPRAYREVARGIIPNALQAAIHEQCTARTDSLEPASAGLSPGQVFPASVQPATGSAMAVSQCGINPADFDVSNAAAELRSEPAVSRLLRFRNSEVRVSIALFDGQRRMAEALLEQLQAGP